MKLLWCLVTILMSITLLKHKRVSEALLLVYVRKPLCVSEPLAQMQGRTSEIKRGCGRAVGS